MVKEERSDPDVQARRKEIRRQLWELVGSPPTSKMFEKYGSELTRYIERAVYLASESGRYNVPGPTDYLLAAAILEKVDEYLRDEA